MMFKWLTAFVALFLLSISVCVGAAALIANRSRIPCGHLTMEHFGENSVDTLERRWEVLVKMREQEINCRRFDNTPGTRKHRAIKLFNERHGLSALFCSGFLARCRLERSRTRMRPPPQRLRCAPGMFNSLEVKVLYPT